MGVNRYSYVGGNPVNFVDPTGMYGETPGTYNRCWQSPQDSTRCVESPSDKTLIRLDPKDPSMGLFSAWGVILSSECIQSRFWTDTQKDNLRKAFRDIDARLIAVTGRDFRSVFRGLELRHLNRLVEDRDGVPKPNIGQTISGTQIQFGNEGTLNESDATNQVNADTIIHELGHVLENRTRSNATGMQTIALIPGQEALWIPAVGDVAPGKALGGIGDIKETLADYFLFWTHSWYGESNQYVEIATAYMDSGWVSILPPCSNSKNCLPKVENGPGSPSERTYIHSPGMPEWALQANSYATLSYNDFANVAYQDLINS